MFKKTILFTAILSLVFLSACSLKKEKELTLEEAKVRAEQFINENFMDPAYPIEISNIFYDKQTGLYKFSIDLGEGQTVDSYISKDGKKFFPQAYEISELEKTLNGSDEGQTQADVTGQNSGSTTTSANFNESASLSTEKKLAVYFFWGDGCPHCSNQKTFMAKWAEKYPDVEIKTYETWNNQDNGAILEKLASAYGANVQGVPMTFIGDKYWVGYTDSLGAEMEKKIDECLAGKCENPGDRIK